MGDPANILLALIDTNRALARLIVMLERERRSEHLTVDVLDREILGARDTYFRAKQMAIENGKFEGGFIPS